MERYHLQLSRLQRGRNRLQGATSNGRLHLAFWRIRARRQSLIPDVQGVQLQRPNMSFACTDCFGPHNIEKHIMVKKAVKRYRSNNLKNDYESEEINSQDSEHYLQPHFMDGYIKRDDYLYITTGYLHFDKTLLYSSAEDSSDEEDYDPNARTPQTLPVAPLEIPRQFPRRQAAQAIRGHHHYECSTPHQIRTRTRSRRPLHQGTAV